MFNQIKSRLLAKITVFMFTSLYGCISFANPAYKVMGYGDGSDHEIQIKAEQGDKDAQAFLCDITHQMQKHHDMSEARIYWCEKSAEQGIAKSQYLMGEFYHQGNGVEQDFEKARYWLEKSANQGYDYAQLNLGVIYYQGDGVPVDYKKAVYWYQNLPNKITQPLNYI